MKKKRFGLVCLVGATGLLVPALWGQGGTPSISAGGVVSASAFGQFKSIAPGSWIEIYGSNLAVDSRSWGGGDFNGVNAPTSLDGTKVTIGGQPAYVDYISPTQVNAQVPFSVGTGSQPVVVTNGNVASAAFTINVNAEEPGLLAPSSFAVNGTQFVAALFTDGVTYVLPPGSIAGLPSRRAQPGDTITLYGIGFGPVTPNIPAGQVVQQSNVLSVPLHVFFGTTEAVVSYDGLAPSAVGLYQINVVVPNVASSDAVPLTFSLGGVSGTQILYTAVQNGTPPAAKVQAVTLSATSVTGGGVVQGTVTLSTAAPAGGALVGLVSSSSAASVPATITIPAGATSGGFTVTTGSVNATQSVTITATYGGGSAQASLSVTAPPSGGTVANFSSLIATVTYQPTGSPSSQTIIEVTPNAGNTTFTANLTGLMLLNGTFSNQGQTLTFTTAQPQLQGYPPIYVVGTTQFYVSSMNLTLSFPGPITSFGNVGGSLSFSGHTITDGSAVSFSGAITGTYFASIVH
ncbi:MAG TPA: IPT/TIG domain-containing protein [Bryobacteraceae bacterium]|nr:IPT/TIG domain-containing protein [Bryobacteraceae bacterium]